MARINTIDWKMKMSQIFERLPKHNVPKYLEFCRELSPCSEFLENVWRWQLRIWWMWLNLLLIGLLTLKWQVKFSSSVSKWHLIGVMNGNPWTVCLFFIINVDIHNWAASWQNQQNGMCPQQRLRSGFRPVWSESLLSAWRNVGSLFTHWVHSEDSDQTGWLPRLIWVFAGGTVILLVLPWGGSIELGHSKT